jgi:hypothetical protein
MPWIKVRTNLAADPRVDEIARRTGRTVQHVLGALVALWSFADEHSTDGRLAFVRRERIDAFCGGTDADFSSALEAVGWLEFLPGVDCFAIPRFAEHNGESAKARAQGAKRVARHRYASGGACNASSVTEQREDGESSNGGRVTREEERREEKKKRARAGGGGL